MCGVEVFVFVTVLYMYISPDFLSADHSFCVNTATIHIPTCPFCALMLSLRLMYVAPAASGSAAPKVEAPKEEEVDALAGGMDMFGGDEGGGDY